MSKIYTFAQPVYQFFYLDLDILADRLISEFENESSKVLLEHFKDNAPLYFNELSFSYKIDNSDKEINTIIYNEVCDQLVNILKERLNEA
jgi:hypothetical protein